MICLVPAAATAQHSPDIAAPVFPPPPGSARVGAGGLVLTGPVLGFDGTYLRLATPEGAVSLVYDADLCTGAACPDPKNFVPQLRLSGASRLGDLILPALIEGYARSLGHALSQEAVPGGRTAYLIEDEEGPVLALSLRRTSTEDGIADLLAEEADVALAARPMTAEEIALARDAGLGAMEAPRRARLIAFDALVPIAAPGQGLRDLTPEDLAEVLAGRITDWQDLGGAALPLTLHLGPEDDGQLQGALLALLGDGELAPDAVRHASAGAVAAAVARDAGGIGLVPFGATDPAEPLALHGGCGLQGHALPETVATADYPLTQPLALYLPARRFAPEAAAFLAWIDTPEAQMVLRRSGVAGTLPLRIPLSAQGGRLASAIAAAGPGADGVPLTELQRVMRVLGARLRLSPTFRFDSGDAQLDPLSESHLRQLAQAIRDGSYRGRRLLLAGFSDGLGDWVSNRSLSEDRARAVRDELLRLLGGGLPQGVTVQIAGLGEALPMGCSRSTLGRTASRRVELWVQEE
ncbi:phosphate ABC transporter substrate-binding/OmpA family protein [Pseudoroseicyclus aestuarii]|uniref:phosphate ABC transporter substrate-binding/OmpA family protein n=1 Tax=Pseudoroseicyclus aestuarii TaxID=1795041 RepID=UPI0015E8844D|nr:phosphate ABC transporter substrate-binding/OmpA family protein [Pseudoroseicyclus aestuarii]